MIERMWIFAHTAFSDFEIRYTRIHTLVICTSRLYVYHIEAKTKTKTATATTTKKQTSYYAATAVATVIASISNSSVTNSWIHTLTLVWG